MFTILMGLTCAVLLILTILNFTVYNRTYGKNQKVGANNLTLQVNNSYLTDVDYSGNTISEGKYFLIVNIDFTNKSGLSTVLDLSNYELMAKSGAIKPTLTRNNYFVDFGAGYSKEKIESGKSYNYILVYEMEKKDIAKKYTLRITDEIEYKAGTLNAKYKNISLKPQEYYSQETVGTYKIGDNMTFYDSILRLK